jgi:hypothetical protein
MLRRGADEFTSVIKNLRVSETAIEFDLYTIDEEKKLKTISKLELEFGQEVSERDLALEETGEVPDKEQVVERSVGLFNEQRFWECHETLEQVWRKETDRTEKDVQQGIILTASAFVHYQRNEDDVCLGMIPRALSKLEKWSLKTYHMIDIELLREELREIQRSKIIHLFKI